MRLNQDALRASVGGADQQIEVAPDTLRSQASPCEPLHAAGLQPLIHAAAAQAGIDPNLVLMVALRESSLQPCAVSSRGAQGLMQLMPETAGELGVRDPFNPEENLAAGARFLSQLLRRYEGDITLALRAYHVGPAAVDGRQGAPMGPDTERYVSDILRMLGPEADARLPPTLTTNGF
ncbi:MAG: lytic transglycosylase domain-containing protein [Bryobacteraceae bacterium]|nr:lytic transglycosylase domain-containing protein [Bryobacteraceae bacterium]